MLKKICAAAVLASLLALPACTSNQIAAPAVTQANLTLSQLQFQVGTANIAGQPGLNTAVTFRQPNGLSAMLVNTPVITLPFTNPAPAALAGTDAATNHVSGTPQGPSGVAEPAATFPQSVGAFAYGFLASNTTFGSNNSVFYPATNSQPYYAALIGVTPRAYYVGPGNAYIPNFNDGSLGTTFVGYPSGFTAFALAPAAGTYALSVGVSAVNATVPTFTATTTLTSTALLGTFPAPSYVSDGAGGGTVSVTVPAGVSETLVDVIDRQRGNYYTLVIRGTGPQTATLAPNWGPPATPGSSVFGPSILPGNGVRLLAVGFDYPAIEAVPVGSAPPQAPVINNAGTACTFSGTSSTCPGQADITIAPSTVWVE